MPPLLIYRSRARVDPILAGCLARPSPKPWRVADVTFVEIEIAHRTDTHLRVEFD